MGTYTFKLPDVGEGIAEAEIVEWHADVGDRVEEDQPLVDVMTEKATVEIGAPVSGTILSRNGGVGDMAPVGAELVVIATADAEVPPPSTSTATTMPATPSAKPNETIERPSRSVRRDRERKPTAAPAVRARADALGIDLASVAGSGKEGRILHEDLDALLLRHGSGFARPAIGAPREGVEEIKVIGLRRQIAQAMQDAKRRIPHFSYVEEVDVTALETLRCDLNDDRAAGRPRLTVLPFLIRALVAALPDHPGNQRAFRRRGRDRNPLRRHSCRGGDATRRGLVVPVIRHVETLDLVAIGAEIERLSEAARSGKASREELSGSTVTVSSLGALGGVAATPIVNQPEVAIIGVNKIVERPVVHDGRIDVRKG